MQAIKQRDTNLAGAKDEASLSRVKTRRRKINPFSPPTTVDVRGVRVHFPFRPYKCQETYMEKVLDALLRSENALLESPTGTGKTLCLLCSTLAWQREQSRLLQQASELQNTDASLLANSQDAPARAARVPTIIYASRTHSQLSQVVRELRNTRYRPQHAVLGSRDQMCVNPKVKKQGCSATDVNHDCSKLGKDRKCRFRNNLDGFTAPANENSGTNTQPVMDMEDLVTMGKSHKVCPFYYTRALVAKAELILVPYNYLFDKDARATTLSDIPWDNAVLIFDEAHNLESFASESASFDLSNTDISGCIAEVQKAGNYLQAMPDLGSNLKEENLVKLKAIFLKLEDYLMGLGNQTAYTGEFMMDFFQQGGGVNHSNHEIFIEELRKVNDLLLDMRGTGATKGSPKLEHFVQCLKRVFGEKLESRCLAKSASYRVHVSPKEQRQSGKQHIASRTVSYWCFAPALAMEELASLNVRSIIVTSGTLSPLPSYSMELGLNFPHTLENPHIVSDNQIHVRVIGKGVSGKELTSSYERRKDGEYYSELGNTLVALSKVTPAGMLVFFPSYSVMETCIERWGGPSLNYNISNIGRSSFFAARQKKHPSVNQWSFPFVQMSYYDSESPKTPWKRLLSTKSVVVEPKSSANLPEAIADFHRFLGMLKSPGCILMGVCRGKISEGIDFANEQSRAVVITGLPFPPSFDAKVKLKREFLDGARAIGSMKASNVGGFADNASSTSNLATKLSGHDWYAQQAHRAVNQAIGRVIRNRSDYGAVLLLDSRFGQQRNQEGLSKWVRPHLKKDEGFGTAVGALAKFYRESALEAEVRETTESKALSKTELVYEEEEELEVTKVAFIRPNEATGNIDSAEETCDAYVPPDQVIARLDMNRKKTSAPETDVSATKTQISVGTLRAAYKPSLFDNTCVSQSSSAMSEPIGKRSVDSKEVALAFMKKCRSLLSSSDLSIIRKSIVAMKSYGDQKDVREYLRSAREILKLIVASESFEVAAHFVQEPTLLSLFFRLLPNAYRIDVETLAMELVFLGSSLGTICKQSLSQIDFCRLQASMTSLLHLLWCSEKPHNVTPGQFLPKAREVVCIAMSQACLEGFLRLVPRRFELATKSLHREICAFERMQRMKEAERKNVGEIALHGQRFRPFSGSGATMSDGPFGKLSASMTDEPSNAAEVRQLKRKQPDTTKHMHVNPYLSKTRPACNVANITAKKLTVRNGATASTQPSTKAQKGYLSTYLQAVESSEPYVHRSAEDRARAVQSSSKAKVICPVCNEISSDPFIAECGHMACRGCWLDWLKRSATCATCRQEVTKEMLARAVFQKSAKVPTLSQIGQLTVNGIVDGDSADEELEIC